MNSQKIDLFDLISDPELLATKAFTSFDAEQIRAVKRHQKLTAKHSRRMAHLKRAKERAAEVAAEFEDLRSLLDEGKNGALLTPTEMELFCPGDEEDSTGAYMRVDVDAIITAHHVIRDMPRFPSAEGELIYLQVGGSTEVKEFVVASETAKYDLVRLRTFHDLRDTPITRPIDISGEVHCRVWLRNGPCDLTLEAINSAYFVARNCPLYEGHSGLGAVDCNNRLVGVFVGYQADRVGIFVNPNVLHRDLSTLSSQFGDMQLCAVRRQQLLLPEIDPDCEYDVPEFDYSDDGDSESESDGMVPHPYYGNSYLVDGDLVLQRYELTRSVHSYWQLGVREYAALFEAFVNHTTFRELRNRALHYRRASLAMIEVSCHCPTLTQEFYSMSLEPPFVTQVVCNGVTYNFYGDDGYTESEDDVPPPYNECSQRLSYTECAKGKTKHGRGKIISGIRRSNRLSHKEYESLKAQFVEDFGYEPDADQMNVVIDDYLIHQEFDSDEEEYDINEDYEDDGDDYLEYDDSDFGAEEGNYSDNDRREKDLDDRHEWIHGYRRASKVISKHDMALLEEIGELSPGEVTDHNKIVAALTQLQYLLDTLEVISVDDCTNPYYVESGKKKTKTKKIRSGVKVVVEEPLPAMVEEEKVFEPDDVVETEVSEKEESETEGEVSVIESSESESEEESEDTDDLEAEIARLEALKIEKQIKAKKALIEARGRTKPLAVEPEKRISKKDANIVLASTSKVVNVERETPKKVHSSESAPATKESKADKAARLKAEEIRNNEEKKKLARNLARAKKAAELPTKKDISALRQNIEVRELQDKIDAIKATGVSLREVVALTAAEEATVTPQTHMKFLKQKELKLLTQKQNYLNRTKEERETAARLLQRTQELYDHKVQEVALLKEKLDNMTALLAKSPVDF